MDGDTLYTEQTVEQYVRGILKIDMGDNVVANILFKRNLQPDSLASDLDMRIKELLEADVYWRCSLMPSVSVSIEDADGNWKHKESGGQITEANKKLWRDTAYAIYTKYGENHFAKGGPRIHARGMRIWRTGNGC